MSDLKLSLDEKYEPAALNSTVEFLNRHNQEHGIEYNPRPLGVFITDSDGTVRGGLTGSTNWQWLRIDILAVDPDLRGQGWGARLIDMAEQEARKRGCHHAFVDTYSFQALPFYQSHGYCIFGELNNYPTGHSRYFLQKDLTV